MSSIDERLRAVLRAIGDDLAFAFLALEATGARELETLAALRAAHDEALARGEPSADPDSPEALAAWTVELTRALAADALPWFVPMRSTIEEGLSLARVPKGFLAKLSGAGASERVRRLGALAVRATRAVAAADGPPGDDERRAIDVLLAALALPEDEARVLRVEPPVPIAALELPDGVDGAFARALVGGAWEVAASDGVDVAEHQAIAALARRLAVPEESIDEGRRAAERAVGERLDAGAAALGALRYVLAPCAPDRVAPLVARALHLAVPPIGRGDLRGAIAAGATPLGQALSPSASATTIALANAWAAALSLDPTATLRACLRARHERAAIALGAGSARIDDARVRALVEDHVDARLHRAVATAGG